VLATLVCPGNFPADVPIYYGSQTGTGEKFANIIDEEAHLLGINSRVVDLDKFDAEAFTKHKFAIFVLATHYVGEPTDNAKAFHKWIKQSSRGDEVEQHLGSMEYAMMGLGDRSYEEFNEMA